MLPLPASFPRALKLSSPTPMPRRARRYKEGVTASIARCFLGPMRGSNRWVGTSYTPRIHSSCPNERLDPAELVPADTGVSRRLWTQEPSLRARKSGWALAPAVRAHSALKRLARQDETQLEKVQAARAHATWHAKPPAICGAPAFCCLGRGHVSRICSPFLLATCEAKAGLALPIVVGRHPPPNSRSDESNDFVDYRDTLWKGCADDSHEPLFKTRLC